MRTHLRLACGLLLASVVSANAQSARVEIVLDVSGSMKATMGSQPKIDAAKSAIRETISGIQEGSVVAMRYYGHRVPPEPKAESCKDTELVIPFQPLDRARMLAALGKAVPRGQTPISYSLEQAAGDFGGASDEERAIILVSDGIETCGADPLATVRDLMARGIKVKIHTIGFDVDAAARAQLEGISQATGGEYHDARNAAALADSLRQLTQRALLIARDSAYGQEIRGGNTYEDAVTIQAGTTYHLDHHQRKDDYDYFAIDARDGQKIVATIQAYDVGVKIRGEKFEEGKGEFPYSGIALHASDKQRVAQVWIAEPGQKKGIELPIAAGRGGRFYVLIGNEHYDQHRNARFEVQLVDISDAKSGRDAGADDAGAIDIEPGETSGYLNANDRIDYYAFKVVPKATYSLRAKPNAPEKELVLAVVDRDGVEKKQVKAPNGGAAVRIEALEFPYEGKAFVRVATHEFVQEKLESRYTLELTSTGGPAPAPSAAAASTPAAAGKEDETTPAGVVSRRTVVWIGLAVVAVALLIGVAFVLGRKAASTR
ncbi:von Willebrand factor type A domain protein [Luteitalea pratensis]|uniref:von Willebrand factor type A domain protein n=2 Tax=Luteitalea pratensis TaxID=1855912 RepID=A0A143PJW7_LUTPR|nr:von Willebrand factor type A domain protein [Luteitalea pratensis]